MLCFISSLVPYEIPSFLSFVSFSFNYFTYLPWFIIYFIVLKHNLRSGQCFPVNTSFSLNCFFFSIVPVFLGNPMVSSSSDRGSSENSSSFVLLWSRERGNRRYSMVNCETGVFNAHEEKCEGHRVLCMTKVENRTWLGTEVTVK